MNTIEGIYYKDGKPIRLEIVQDRIYKIIRPASVKTSNFLAPGLIDIQVNGYDGVGFTESDLNKADVLALINQLQAQGVTTFLPTFFTAPSEILLKNLNVLGGFEENPDVEEMMPGFHLEGPYLSELDGPRGAHKKEWSEIRIGSSFWNLKVRQQEE